LELSLGVTFAVLGAALLHASWNAIIKSGSDPLFDTALVGFAKSAFMLPLLFLFPAPAPAAWGFMAISVLVHMGYYTALAGAYKAGDLSHGYPIMRGTAPLLTALGTWLVLGESLSLSAATGVALICAGVLSFGLVGGGASRQATRWALLNAFIICGYTLADGAGVRASGHAVGYVLWINFLNGLPFGLCVLALKRGRFVRHASSAKNWARGASGALLAAFSYGIALWAMTRAPVAIIAALRETSVIFGALIGAWFLKEGHLKQRLSGAAVVLAGLVALKL
jgi:drug/metabolite transporter (DMT)-like permease